MPLKFPRLKARKKIYIVPTRQGFLYGFLVVYLFFISFDHGSFELLFLLSFLVLFGLVSMILTHATLEGLEIFHASLDPGFAEEKTNLILELQTQSHLPKQCIALENTWIHLPRNRARLVVLQPVLKKRGVFEIQKLKFSTTYPLGLFYAWTFWNTPTYCTVYPRKLHGFNLHSLWLKAGPTFTSPKPMEPDPKRSSSSFSDEDGGHHKRTHCDDSFNRIDWRVFARTQCYYAKTPDPSASAWGVLHLSLEDSPGSNREEQLSYLTSAIELLRQHQLPYCLHLENQHFLWEDSLEHHTRCLTALAHYPGEP
ncbi:MAG: hypothetical protein ACO3A2_09590 [Bdellovibrionia bacterium]